MSGNDAIKRKVLKLLQQKPETDSFEISVIINERIEDVNTALERMSGEDGTILIS